MLSLARNRLTNLDRVNSGLLRRNLDPTLPYRRLIRNPTSDDRGSCCAAVVPLLHMQSLDSLGHRAQEVGVITRMFFTKITGQKKMISCSHPTRLWTSPSSVFLVCDSGRFGANST